MLDIGRDARWGRLEETYGEDPYLASRLAVAYVRGLQTADLAGGVVATGKHFLGYGVPEGGMNHAPAHLGPRELRDVVAAPFRAAIDEAGLASVMNAYNDVDGLACAAVPVRPRPSYAPVEYGDLEVDGLAVSCTVTNVGSRDVDEGRLGSTTRRCGSSSSRARWPCSSGRHPPTSGLTGSTTIGGERREVDANGVRPTEVLVAEGHPRAAG